MMKEICKIKKEIYNMANPERASVLRGFFKTGPGEYGEGDVFLGITVPQLRVAAKKYQHISFGSIKKLLYSRIHEERLLALLVLVGNFREADARKKEDIFRFYMRHTPRINNWDLVDCSADKIVGGYLLEYPGEMRILRRLANSSNIWERRIALLATFQFIKQNKFSETFVLVKMLLRDEHDLIHKAAGWMLREVGKRSLRAEENFLKRYYKKMPRTMLRYAIERFPEKKRRAYMVQ